ncbi:MAG: methionyl-tRNA formyltransferase [Succinatimonas sp.]|nr:methionyl-tRNA formyltransferase [Succinatimonas sp.]
MDQKIIFAGTPDFASVSLKALLDAGIRPCAVYTMPDRPAKRGHHLTPSPIKELALQHGLEVRTPENFKSEEELCSFEELHADLCIVVAYGMILPERILKAPRLGCINVHGSLLPAYRGAAPIQRSLLDGCEKTGVSIMQLVKKLDAGDVFVSESVPIDKKDTSGTLFDKLAKLGAQTLLKYLGPILAGTIRAIPQDESKATYAEKITKDMAPLNFCQSAKELDLLIRGLNPWPIATATLDGICYKIFEAVPVSSGIHKHPGEILSFGKEGIEIACSDGSLLVKIMQSPGKGRVKAADFARSCPQKFEGKNFDCNYSAS